MSWQRIIELARRQGMPMIITDVAGREPMVVLPLDVYEGMLNQEEPGQTELGQKAKVKGQRSEAGQEDSVPESRPGYLGLVSPVSSNQPPAPPRPTPPPIRPPQDGLRVRQRDEDRTQALHRSLDTVSHAISNPLPSPSSSAPGLVMEERFSFQP